MDTDQNKVLCSLNSKIIGGETFLLQTYEKSPPHPSQVCPECGEDICVGLGGSGNMSNHIGKAWCCKVKAAKKKSCINCTNPINEIFFYVTRTCRFDTH